MPSKITIIFNTFNFNKFKTIIISSQIGLFPIHKNVYTRGAMSAPWHAVKHFLYKNEPFVAFIFLRTFAAAFCWKFFFIQYDKPIYEEVRYFCFKSKRLKFKFCVKKIYLTNITRMQKILQQSNLSH